jgi:hypothetical protein
MMLVRITVATNPNVAHPAQSMARFYERARRFQRRFRRFRTANVNVMPGWRGNRVLVTVALAVTALAATAVACGSHPGPSAPRGAPAPAPALAAQAPKAHVVVVVFENHGYREIIGNSQAPYFNRLANRFALATRYHAIRHPSLPNYLALSGGRTFGITSDCTTCTVDAVNLGDQIQNAELSWRLYAESMPGPCFQGAFSGRYAKKHVPFLYYRDIAPDSRRCRSHVVPLKQLWSDIATDRLPNFSFVVPNLCHDMHDCSVARGNSWLHWFMRRVLPTSAVRSDGAVVVTFDEDDGTPVNHVATIVVNPRGKRGRRMTGSFSHYSLVRAVDAAFGLSPLGHAKSARSLPLGPLP